MTDYSGTYTPKSPINITLQQDNECFAHEIGTSCECEYCFENLDCDINEKGKICKGQWEHSEMCAECVLLSGIPRYSKIESIVCSRYVVRDSNEHNECILINDGEDLVCPNCTHLYKYNEDNGEFIKKI